MGSFSWSLLKWTLVLRSKKKKKKKILTSRQPHSVTQDELKREGFKKQQQQSGNKTGSALGQGAYSHENM